MTPEEIARVLTAYTRALARSTMRGDTLPAVLATEIEMEIEAGKVDAGGEAGRALALAVTELRSKPRPHPAD